LGYTITLFQLHNLGIVTEKMIAGKGFERKLSWPVLRHKQLSPSWSEKPLITLAGHPLSGSKFGDREGHVTLIALL
jgi:hypothetical protein